MDSAENDLKLAKEIMGKCVVVAGWPPIRVPDSVILEIVRALCLVRADQREADAEIVDECCPCDSNGKIKCGACMTAEAIREGGK